MVLYVEILPSSVDVKNSILVYIVEIVEPLSPGINAFAVLNVERFALIVEFTVFIYAASVEVPDPVLNVERFTLIVELTVFIYPASVEVPDPVLNVERFTLIVELTVFIYPASVEFPVPTLNVERFTLIVELTVFTYEVIVEFNRKELICTLLIDDTVRVTIFPSYDEIDDTEIRFAFNVEI